MIELISSWKHVEPIEKHNREGVQDPNPTHKKTHQEYEIIEATYKPRSYNQEIEWM